MFLSALVFMTLYIIFGISQCLKAIRTNKKSVLEVTRIYFSPTWQKYVHFGSIVSCVWGIITSLQKLSPGLLRLHVDCNETRQSGRIHVCNSNNIDIFCCVLISGCISSLWKSLKILCGNYWKTSCWPDCRKILHKNQAFRSKYRQI